MNWDWTIKQRRGFKQTRDSYLVQSLSLVRLFVTSWTAACQAPLSFTLSQSLLKLMSIESVMPSKHLVLFLPFSCPQSFPASGSFPMSWLFTSGGQSIGSSVSVSVLAMNIQGWFPLGLTGWISLQSKKTVPLVSPERNFTKVSRQKVLGMKPEYHSHDISHVNCSM